MSHNDNDDVMVEEVVPSNDEEETNGNGHLLPDVLHIDATPRDVVMAINGLALETQLTRRAVARIGTRIASNETALEERLEAFERVLTQAVAALKGK